jgi:NADH:ubiquinone oxidoreductase subunit H
MNIIRVGLTVSCGIRLLRVFVGRLIRVAFFIVIERKGLGHFQLRHGPNKPRVKGIGQALADGVKLMVKDWFTPSGANKSLFVAGPMIIFCVSFVGWVIFPRFFISTSFNASLVYYMCLGALRVYGVFLCG